MNYFIICNPGSRNGRSVRSLKTIERFFVEHNLSYELAVTENMDHAYRLSVQANRAGFDTIIACGGDGTINMVLNGFFGSDGKRISKARMGIVYTGTSPDFCKSYHIPFRGIDQALHTIVEGKTTRIQVGKIMLAKTFVPGEKRVGRNHPHFTTRYFGCCVNVGLGATLASHANSGIRKLCGDTLGTFLSLLKTLSGYRPENFIVHRDGKQCAIENLFNLSIGKTHHIASGIKVHSGLEEGDGRFYNLLVQHLTPLSFLPCMRTIYGGKPFRNTPFVSLSYTRELEVESPGKACEVEFDGDPQGFLPCRITMAEEPLDLITEKNNG
jgi:diacylglycerol kinase family enzyme